MRVCNTETGHYEVDVNNLYRYRIVKSARSKKDLSRANTEIRLDWQRDGERIKSNAEREGYDPLGLEVDQREDPEFPKTIFLSYTWIWARSGTYHYIRHISEGDES